MIVQSHLGDLPLRMTLPANAPIRCSRPAQSESTDWVYFRLGTWIQKLTHRKMIVPMGKGTEEVPILFDPVGLRFLSETADLSIWDHPQAKLLQSQVLTEVAERLEASVPRLPDSLNVVSNNFPMLTWPKDTSRNDPASVRRLQKARLRALADKAGYRSELLGTEPSGAGRGLSLEGRLLAGMSSIPRPVDVHLDLSWDRLQQRLVINWRQSGNLALIWGARVITLKGVPPRLSSRLLSRPEMEAREATAAEAMVYAIALGFAQAFGGAAFSVVVRFTSKQAANVTESDIHIDPDEWGFGLPERLLKNHRLGNT